MCPCGEKRVGIPGQWFRSPRALTLGNSPPGKDSSIEPHITGYGRSSSLWLWSIVLRLSGC